MNMPFRKINIYSFLLAVFHIYTWILYERWEKTHIKYIYVINKMTKKTLGFYMWYIVWECVCVCVHEAKASSNAHDTAHHLSDSFTPYAYNTIKIYCTTRPRFIQDLLSLTVSCRFAFYICIKYFCCVPSLSIFFFFQRCLMLLIKHAKAKCWSNRHHCECVCTVFYFSPTILFLFYATISVVDNNRKQNHRQHFHMHYLSKFSFPRRIKLNAKKNWKENETKYIYNMF